MYDSYVTIVGVTKLLTKPLILFDGKCGSKVNALDELVAKVSNLIYSRNLNENSNIIFSLEDNKVCILSTCLGALDHNASVV